MRILNALWQSFFSRSLYREVFAEWRGIGLLYLLLLALIQTIVSTSQLDARIDVMIRDYSPALIQQLPTLTLKDGHMSTPEERPYSIYSAGDQKRVVLIDTSLEEAPSDLGETPVFIGKTKMQYLNAFRQSQTFDFSIARDMVLDQNLAIIWLKFFSDWAALCISPLLWSIQCLVLMLQALFFSLFAYMSLKSEPVKTSYASILRLTSVALTPTILFSLIFSIFMTETFLSSFLYVFLAVGYISYATGSIKNPEKEPSDRDSEI